MEKQAIFNNLEKVVAQRGGKKRGGKHDLGEVSLEYKNQYVDDGSLQYEKIKLDVVKNLAGDLFAGDTSLRAMREVPENAIDRVMTGLKHIRGRQIEDLVKENKKMMKSMKLLEKDKDVVKYLNQLAVAKTNNLENEYNNIRDRDLEQFKPFKSSVKARLAVNPKDLKLAEDLYYPSQDLAENMKKLGLTASGRKKPKLSEAEIERRSKRMRDYHKNKK